jgi:hypothetical protein
VTRRFCELRTCGCNAAEAKRCRHNTITEEGAMKKNTRPEPAELERKREEAWEAVRQAGVELVQAQEHSRLVEARGQEVVDALFHQLHQAKKDAAALADEAEALLQAAAERELEVRGAAYEAELAVLRGYSGEELEVVS